jgi:hypothetical protein
LQRKLDGTAVGDKQSTQGVRQQNPPAAPPEKKSEEAQEASSEEKEPYRSLRPLIETLRVRLARAWNTALKHCLETAGQKTSKSGIFWIDKES